MTPVEEFLVAATLLEKLRANGCNLQDVDICEVTAASVDKWAQCTFDHLDSYSSSGEESFFSAGELFAIQKLSDIIARQYTFPRFEILVYNDQPDWSEVNNKISIYDKPYIVPINTGGSEFAICIADGYISQKDVNAIYACGPSYPFLA